MSAQQAFLSEMLDAYIACALWSSTDDKDVPMDSGDREIADETRKQMQDDCEDFIANNWPDLESMDPAQAGHDFWLTRNHHGAGFWDRGLGELGNRLTAAAHAAGDADLYVGDDGKVYQ